MDSKRSRISEKLEMISKLNPSVAVAAVSNYSQIKTNMLVLVLNGITKPFNHRDTETQRKARDARPGPLCLCVFVVKSSGISMAAQALFPRAVSEKGRDTIHENVVFLRAFSSGPTSDL